MLRAKARAGKREGGFTYLGLIVTLAIVGLVGAATLKIDALLRRAAAEEELLEIGAAYSAALRSYADATPRGQPQLPPPSLQELLKDPRYPGVRRHLRKIFVDPMTGKTAWGIVYADNQNGGSGRGVLAVYSLSQARPFKRANFDARFQNLDNKEHISDWKFAATGQTVVQPTMQPAAAAPGMPGQALPGQAVSGQTASGQPPAPSLFGQPPSDPSPPAAQAAMAPDAPQGEGPPPRASQASGNAQDPNPVQSDEADKP